MKVLIVEDEEKLRQHLAKLLLAEGHTVFTKSTTLELENIEKSDPEFDVIILDRLLFGFDSARFIPEMKDRMLHTRILVLSAINTPTEKALVLDMGADDYLAKPFEGKELVARVKALARRTGGDLSFGDIKLDTENRSIKIAGHEVGLTNKEFLLMRTLIKSPGKIFNKAHFYETVWGMSPEVDSNVVEVTIKKLRSHLEENGSTVHIRNARNMGYWIEK